MGAVLLENREGQSLVFRGITVHADAHMTVPSMRVRSSDNCCSARHIRATTPRPRPMELIIPTPPVPDHVRTSSFAMPALSSYVTGASAAAWVSTTANR